MVGVGLTRWIVVAGLAVALAGCGASSQETAPSVAVDRVVQLRPAAETAFVAVPHAYEQARLNPINDIAKDQADANFYHYACDQYKAAQQFVDWTGKVDIIIDYSRSDSPRVEVWIKISDDLNLQEEVPVGSPVYVALLSIPDKSAVKISGAFTHKAEIEGEEGQCANQTMFNVNLTRIAPL